MIDAGFTKVGENVAARLPVALSVHQASSLQANKKTLVLFSTNPVIFQSSDLTVKTTDPYAFGENQMTDRMYHNL